jgi:hypothetical protein
MNSGEEEARERGNDHLETALETARNRENEELFRVMTKALMARAVSCREISAQNRQ